MRIVVVASLVATACSAAPQQSGQAASTQDTRAYAVAACFAAQDVPMLREQGERWAGAVIARGAGPTDVWGGIADAVKAELTRNGVRQGQGEGPAGPTIALPVMTCGEIADTPGVAAALTRADAVLEPAYRARMRPASR